MAEHIIYEIDAFREGFECWRKLDEQAKKSGVADLWERNRIVEQALLHFRVLREFFIYRTGIQPKHEDDVVAWDYTTNWDKELNRLVDNNTDLDGILKETKEAIDTRVAHVTTGRLTQGHWKRGQMESTMNRLVMSFKKQLAADKVDWFSRLAVVSTDECYSAEGASGTQTNQQIDSSYMEADLQSRHLDTSPRVQRGQRKP